MTAGRGDGSGGRRRPGRRVTESGVASITSAPEPLEADLTRRAHRYLVQMSIRMACFVGAVLVDHWTRWLLLAGAVVLPYVAVVLANAGRERGQVPDTYLEAPSLPATPQGPPR